MIEVGFLPGTAPQSFARVRKLLARAGAQVTFVEGVRALTLAVPTVGRPGVPEAVRLRKELGVFAQHRPVKSLPGVVGRHGALDLLLVRETTEDVYAHLEHESIPGVFESLKVTTRAATERIARHAYETARALGRKKVTIVHKANIMKLSDGLFHRVCREVAAGFPELETEDVIVDALCMKLVLDPGKFDVLLCGNLYGDILSDLAAGLVGAEGNAPAVNHALDGRLVFTSASGDAPDADGTPAANVLPVLVPALLLLERVGQAALAASLREATGAAIRDHRPIALGGSVAADAFLARIG